MKDQAKVKELVEQIIELRDKVCSAITELPDNPKIERLNHNCFIIKKNDMTIKNWSVEYYDFKLQYNMVVKSLKDVEIVNVFNKFEKIINEGKVPQYVGPNRYYYQVLNPIVINHLKTLL